MSKIEEHAEKNRKALEEMVAKRLKKLEDTYFIVPGIVGP